MKKGLICLLVLSVMGTACSSHTNTTVSAQAKNASHTDVNAQPKHNVIDIKLTRDDAVLMDSTARMTEEAPTLVANTQTTTYRVKIDTDEKGHIKRIYNEDLQSGPTVSIQSKNIENDKFLIKLAFDYKELLELRRMQITNDRNAYFESPITTFQKTEYRGVVANGVETTVYENTIHPSGADGLFKTVDGSFNQKDHHYKLTITAHK